MTPAIFAALGEPNRFRIVELLGASPRSVGEIAIRLRLRQPQVTKHLQALERAGLVTMHPLGQRRIYALRREALRELERWAAGFAVDHPSEDVLVRYQAAIEAERALMEQAGGREGARTFAVDKDMAAPPERVWRAWTSADEVRRWWSPDHFNVVNCTVDAVVGGTLRIVMGEPDGSRHAAAGRFLALRPPHELVFELSPLDAAGSPLFDAVHRVRLTRKPNQTRVAIAITVTGVRPEAAAAVAGIELGWQQVLDKLARHLADEPRPGGA